MKSLESGVITAINLIELNIETGKEFVNATVFYNFPKMLLVIGELPLIRTKQVKIYQILLRE